MILANYMSGNDHHQEIYFFFTTGQIYLIMDINVSTSFAILLKENDECEYYHSITLAVIVSNEREGMTFFLMPEIQRSVS